MHEQLTGGRWEALKDWQQAPGAAESVPTSEHFDPVLFAAGAATTPATAPAEQLFEGWQLGSLSLASYTFP